MKKVDDVRRAGLKKCNRCAVFRPMNQFYARLDKENRCKQCVSELRAIAYKKDPAKVINRVRWYRRNNPEKIQDSKLKQTYNIDRIKWEKMFHDQGGVCKICKQPETMIWRSKLVKLAVDHDHETLEVRALLCIRCNTALGLLKEDLNIVLAMADYIKNSRS